MTLLANQATLEFIRQHRHDDIRQLALQGRKYPEVDMVYALEQIYGRQKAETKLPTWASLDGIIYPAHISMEQCSSEITAKYKAKIAGSGTLFVDLTAGFGVDAAFISRNFLHAVTVEKQSCLCDISSANYKLLGYDNIQVVCGDGVEYLHTMKSADLIFIDPARRDEHGSRTYGIADCTPNILPLLDELLEKAERVMIKLSPMLDWRKAVDDLGKVSEVHIVSVDNECKELLLIVSRQNSPLKMCCVNNDNVFECQIDSSAFFSPVYQCESPVFLYEPNASIMKGGCFGAVSERFNISQIEKNSHLFISDKEVPDFPGRHFIIDKITSLNKRDLKLAFDGIEKANITIRNFPMSVSELRKRLKLGDGGNTYIFATTVADGSHRLFVCRKKS